MRLFRVSCVALIGCVILATGVVGVISCHNRIQPRSWDDSTPSGDSSPEQYKAEGEQVVGEICAFRLEYGHWPVSLVQLPPGRVPAGWKYRFEPDRLDDPFWEIGLGDSSPRSSIRFVFGLANRYGSWNVSWDGFGNSSRTVVTFPDAKTGARQPHAAVVAKLLADRKADSAHTLLYTKVLLQLRFDAGEVETAIAECFDALVEHPNDVWLTSFLTAALVRDGAAMRDDPLPVEKRALVTGRFVDYVHAACICHELGLTVRTKKMLDEAFTQERLQSLPDEPGIQGDFWCGAVLALRLRDYERLARVAEAWSAYRSKRGSGDDSFRAFRAFANLKTGRLDEARTEMRELIQQLHRMPIWAQNTYALSAAVEKGDTAFEFDPGSFPELGTCVLHVR